MNTRITTIRRNDVMNAIVGVEAQAGTDTANMIRAYIISLEASCDHVTGLLEKANAQIAALEAKVKACELESDEGAD